MTSKLYMETLIDPRSVPNPARCGIPDILKRHHAILTASICLVVLVAAMKNLLGVPPEILQRDSLVYIIIYFGFLVMSFSIGDDETRDAVAPVYWDVLVIAITLAILVTYAL